MQSGAERRLLKDLKKMQQGNSDESLQATPINDNLYELM